MLSPYSWHPSYIVGHSLRDPHAPAFSSTHSELIDRTMDSMVDGEDHWDACIGGYQAGYDYGAANAINESDDLLQIGRSSVIRAIGNQSATSENDILPYDIAFEVNQSIWDDYFVSSLSLDETTESYLSVIPNAQHCEIQPSTKLSKSYLTAQLMNQENAAGNGFWLNGYYYRKTTAFNVNSTSVPAWTAFLTSTLTLNREIQDGSTIGDKAMYSRTKYPVGIADTSRGMRALSADEVNQLAIAIVEEVKSRGPFISLADFVNRRLTEENDITSHMGTLDAAIFKSGLNQKFYTDPTYSTSSVSRGTDANSIDNNHNLFSESYIYNNDDGVQTSQRGVHT